MKSVARVLVPLAEGFEEIEAVTIIDTLRRAGIVVTTAGLRATKVDGAHGISVMADTTFDQVGTADFDMLVLPGGMPGTTNLAENARVLAFIRAMHQQGKRLSAICAAPMVLAKAGVLGKTPVTCYPGVESTLGDAPFRADERVVKSGKVITSRGPGTALEFSLAIVEELCGAEKAAELTRAMIARV
ncbi:MAG: DJ-1/PfpI family protein [Planctomycetes bacterium]|nr:DJ-1/PfpI family protein [Planctomycetota bacterium]